MPFISLAFELWGSIHHSVEIPAIARVLAVKMKIVNPTRLKHPLGLEDHGGRRVDPAAFFALRPCPT